MSIWDELGATQTANVEMRHGQSEEEKNANERALYRLQMLGLIRDYVIDYSQGINNSKILVSPQRDISIEQIRQNLIHALEKVHQIDLKKDESEKQRIRTTVRNRVEDGLGMLQYTLFSETTERLRIQEQIQKMMEILLEEVHREVQKMRLVTLTNLLSYTKQEQRCKRAYLLSHFEEYSGSQNCGNCDSCQRDFDFRGRARIDPDKAGYADVIHDVSQVMEKFDLAEVDRAIAATRERNLQTSIIGMAENRLQSAPNNLASRLLAGKFRSESSEKWERDLAFQHFMHGYIAADGLHRNRDFARRFYHEASTIDSDASLDFIEGADGVFDASDEYEFVYSEFRRVKPTDERTLRLGTLVSAQKQADVTAAVCTDDNFALLDSILSE